MIHVFPPNRNESKQHSSSSNPYSLLRSKWPSIKQQSVIEIIYKEIFFENIMETKSDIEFNSVKLNAFNKSEIATEISCEQLHSVWKICTVRPAYRLYLNESIKQWYLSENKMFQRPRRRKFTEKRTRQGHNLRRMFAKMLCDTDNLPVEDSIFVQAHQSMLKSTIVDTMWNV